MQGPPSISDLHRLALRLGWPRGEVHKYLHDAAVGCFSVRSLTDLDDRQRQALADAMVSLHRQGESARAAFPRRRHPRGRPPEPGVICLASDAQRRLINRLFSQLGWTRGGLVQGFLRTHHHVDSVEQITTSRQGSAVINQLIGCCREKARKSRGVRPTRH